MAEFNIRSFEVEYKKGLRDSDLTSITPIIGFLRSTVSPWLSKSLTKLKQNPAEVEARFVTLRSQFQTPVSRVFLSASYIREYQTTKCYRQTQQQLEQGDRGKFFVWYVLAMGIYDSTLCIDRAEGLFKRGVKEEVIQAYGSEFGDYTPEFLEESSKRFVKYHQLLIQDPTGITLMDHQVLRHSREMFDFPSIELPYDEYYGPFYHPTATLAAMYAAEVYRTIYPLSERKLKISS